MPGVLPGPKDPWSQGLRVFDLTEMAWVDSYNSDAPPYQTPQFIKYGIAINGAYPLNWDDPTLFEWLLDKCKQEFSRTILLRDH